MRNGCQSKKVSGKKFPIHRKDGSLSPFSISNMQHMIFNFKRLREVEMKVAVILCVALTLVACEHFPLNPSKEPLPSKVATIGHVLTEYVSAQAPIDGIAADKVNVLYFNLRVDNFKPVAVEFYGRAILEGPPGNNEHSIHFRTDTINLTPVESPYHFNILNSIDPGVTYSLLRAKFPTNEYAPFEGDQGKVTLLTITEAWAFDEGGNSHSLELIQ